MSGPNAFVLTLLMLAAFVLAAAGTRLVLKKQRHKGSLMLLAAVVFVINVLIWTL